MNVQQTIAFVVGIDKYAIKGAEVSGPVSHAVELASWFVDKGIPPENLHTFLSPRQLESIPENASYKEATKHSIESAIIEKLTTQKAEFFLFYWCGHGLMENTPELRRCLLYQDQ